MRFRSALLLLVLSAATASAAAPRRALARPLDLADARARTIEVRFERSPRSDPATLDADYGRAVLAHFEVLPSGLARITIEGALAAAHLFEGERVRPESFGDFVWLIDRDTGDVVDARFEGVIERAVDWGFATTLTEARVRARMNTLEPAGIRAPRHVFGNRVFAHCDPSRETDEDDCRRVDAVRFDRERGYVNAVGVLEVETGLGIGASTFSPLGEALLLECGDPEAGPSGVDVAASPPSLR